MGSGEHWARSGWHQNHIVIISNVHAVHVSSMDSLSDVVLSDVALGPVTS